MPTKISQILPPPTKVPMGDNFFEVRGLTLPEIVVLIAQFRRDFVRLLILMRSGMPNFEDIVETAPGMVNDILIYATNSKGDTVEEAAISQIPAGVQLIALSEIWKLTVTDQKKIQELLLGVTVGALKLLSVREKEQPPSDETLPDSPPKTEP